MPPPCAVPRVPRELRLNKKARREDELRRQGKKVVNVVKIGKVALRVIGYMNEPPKERQHVQLADGIGN